MSSTVINGDSRRLPLAAGSVRCCVTSPPYWGLRDYGVDQQIGLESDVDTYIAELVGVFREVRRVLSDDGTLWLNLGDTFTSGGGTRRDEGLNGGPKRTALDLENRPRRMAPASKPKDKLLLPHRVALALQADGWTLRQDIVWSKPNPLPESVTDRPTTSHEYVFLFSKSEIYFYDDDAMKEPSTQNYKPRGNGLKTVAMVNGDACAVGRIRANASFARPAGPAPATRRMRSVWTIATTPYREAHFATFPVELARRCVLGGSAVGDVVLDPFAGAGTTGVAAAISGRDFVGVELNPKFAALARRRIARSPAFQRALVGGAA